MVLEAIYDLRANGIRGKEVDGTPSPCFRHMNASIARQANCGLDTSADICRIGLMPEQIL